MKQTSLSPEAARNLLREKQRRNRLAAKELRVQYPQFATIRVDLVFDDEFSQPPAPQSIVLHPPARAYFVYPCPYAGCTGELDLAANVDHIAEQGKARAAGHARCNGQRPGRQGKVACDLHIKYSIAVGK
ncbi:MAG TPA: hypothetical protein VFS13_11770 [Steroidobacteraceae bacterium]|jgi:hypothetical protein|nr:hypothetical protein [Steroidobacteraceae bacterium]